MAVAVFFCSAASIEPVPTPRFSGARLGYSLFARGLRGDDLRFQRPNDGNGARRRRLRMSVNEVAQVQETCDARLVALVGVGDIDRFVKFEKRHSVRSAFLGISAVGRRQRQPLNPFRSVRLLHRPLSPLSGMVRRGASAARSRQEGERNGRQGRLRALRRSASRVSPTQSATTRGRYAARGSA